MCGMYFVEDDLEERIETLVKMVNRERGLEDVQLLERDEQLGISARDVRPTDEAPILSIQKEGLHIRKGRWGLPGFQKNQVIFNVRSETAMDKFREGILRNRIVIPCSGFYEWNQRKEKNTFKRPDGKAIFMAGFCKGFGEDERYTILTTAANASMKMVHDRMPLILEESEIEPWLFKEDWTNSLLRKVPGELSRSAEYEQLSLF